MWKKVFSFFKNLYVLTVLAFILFLLFFDRNDLITQYKMRAELRKLQNEKRFFEEEINKDKEKLKELKTNPKTLEKFAREKYLMKKENGEIFVIVEEKKTAIRNP